MIIIIQEFSLVASDGSNDDPFGLRVSVTDDKVVIATRGDDNAYIFNRTSILSAWTQQQKLVHDQTNLSFVVDASVSSDTVVLGTRSQDTKDKGGQVFSQPTDDSPWTGRDAQSDHKFGRHLSIHADTLVVGASGDGGGTYFFDRSSAGADWTQQ